MKKYIDYFLNYMQTRKDASPNTIHKYKSDLNKSFSYLNSHYDITKINKIEIKILWSYLTEIIRKKNCIFPTISNKIHITKHFF